MAHLPHHFKREGGQIKKIHENAGESVVMICLQKAEGKEYGRGGEITAEKSRLYLTLERAGKIRIVKGKNWATDKNPNKLQREFKLIKGAKFVWGEDWFAPVTFK